MKIQKFTTKIGDKKLSLEIGKYAAKANGACTAQVGGTVVLATVVMGKEDKEIDYFPLLVDYEERLYAAGKIKGSRWIKREGRPSDEAIITARLVDRAIRPLFDYKLRKEVQVILTVLSYDHENDPDILSLIATSTALAISDIPWQGPVGGVRVILNSQKEWLVNPSISQTEEALLELVLSGREEDINMIEAKGKEIREEKVLEGMSYAQEYIKKIYDFILSVQNKIGKPKQEIGEDYTAEEKEKEAKLREKVEKYLKGRFKEIFKLPLTKQGEAIQKLKEELDTKLKEDSEVTKEERAKGIKLVDELFQEEARQLVLKEGRRVDGRKPKEIRPLYCEVGTLPRTHGSAVFNRGDTQILSIVTLGAPSQEQYLETLDELEKKRFMHHYNFPGFSTGEVSPLRAPGRREIGHGALVEKALLPVLPSREDFPYTIRVVSEVLSSNGSTSMASACASSLALMDAGVPIKEAVGGIACGLIYDDKTKKYKILTDIQGVEDWGGDMDLKIAGTRKGVTAIQMDTKLKGIPFKILKEAFNQSREARLEILKVMNKVLAKPRDTLSPFAPRIYTIKINPERIRDVIGPGGKVINEIIAQTGVTIDIEPDGLVMVTSQTKEGADKAIEWIKNLTREVKIGEVLQGKVTRILDFGAIVEILPHQEGLLHISELAPFRVNKVSDIVKVGDIIPVKVINIDEHGRINLSLKAVRPLHEYPRPPKGAKPSFRKISSRFKQTSRKKRF